METTLIILKPDAIQRGLIGRIITRFEDKGLKLAGAKFMSVPEDLAGKHYAEHEGKPFYPKLISFITSSPVLVMAIRGPKAVAVCRKLIGATKGYEAEAGTIRGDFGLSAGMNMIHGSDSPESAQRELELWFDASELTDYPRVTEAWSYESDEA